MRARLKFVLGLVFFVLTLHGGAQEKPVLALPDTIVPADWVQKRLGDASVVILHVGGDADYAAGHLPGARLVKLTDVSVLGETGLQLELPPTGQLAKRLGELGISAGDRIVIYHGTNSVQSATRVWFTFDYLGLGGKAALLDGGLALWKREGRPLSTEVVTPSPLPPLEVKPRPAAVVDLRWMRDQNIRQSYTLMDARTSQYYSGADAGTMPRSGHIPGAVSAPYPTFFDAEGRWKSPAALRELLAPQGSMPTRLVTYCHRGQQATVPYVAARLLGIDVKLFDGSFQAWSGSEELPVDK